MKYIRISKWPWLLFLVVCAGAGLAAKDMALSKTSASSAGQDIMSLDRRLTAIEQRFSSLEQRLYPIQSSISRLEQQARSIERSTPTQPLRDPEFERLRGELELLKLRLREIECGVVRLDERTLSAGAREARRRAGRQSNDTCRQNPEAPVELSIR